MKTSLTMAAALMLAATTASADWIYRWTDARGITHYSNVQPDDRGRDVSLKHRASQSVPPGGSLAAAEGADASSGPDAGDVAAEPKKPSREFSTEASRLRREIARAWARLEARERQIASRERFLESPPRLDLSLDVLRVRARVLSKPPPATYDSADLEESREEILDAKSRLAEKWTNLEEEARERYGSLPGWWRPLEQVKKATWRAA